MPTVTQMEKARIWGTMQCNKLSMQASLTTKALSTCECFQLEDRKVMDESLKLAI